MSETVPGTFNYPDGKTAGVTFKIRNNGDRILSKIKIIVYFRNDYDEIIAEDIFYPVNTSSYNSDFNKPLKPNYIWQIPKDKFLSAKSVPDEWEEGNVLYDIANFEFAED